MKTHVMGGDEIIANETQENDWLAYGRTHSEQRFSPSAEIDTGNVSNLKPDWFMDLPDDVGLVSTPLVIDAVMYFTGTMNVIRAVDAATGKLIWTYDPEVFKEVGRKKQVGFVHNRGISFSKGKIFAATWDGRLFALDAKTGKLIWSVKTFGDNEALYITGAPKAFKDKVLIGNGGTENGPSRGYVTAYDQETGKQAWRFYIVPGNPADGFENDAMKMAAETWTGEWWKHGGGGNSWHGFTYDAELDQLYIGTGNGSPWNRKIRSPGGGDNLFLCSVVALDPDSGTYKWHYQTTPGESWDYNSNMDIVLADIEKDGKKIKALMHAPKNGFFYVIDRHDGKLISAEPFTETSWATHIDMTTGRPVEVPGARYETAKAYITPNAWGGHSWHAMAYNPLTKLVYIPTIHYAAAYSDSGMDIRNWKSVAFFGGTGVNTSGTSKKPREYPASLQAWDPVKQKAAWSIPQQTPMNAGVLTTAGNLVFQGRSDGKLIAYNARTGDSLWVFNAGLGISAPPITYKVNGKQYIALLVGWGGIFSGLGTDLGWSYGVHRRRLISFSLDGKAEIPVLPPPTFVMPIIEPGFVVNDSLAAKGGALFGLCGGCHGRGAQSKGMAPDLRASAVPLKLESFAEVVRAGTRAKKAMPMFPDMTDDQLTAIMHFIRKQANDSKPVVVTGAH